MNDAITAAKQIDEQSKFAGFYQEALDHTARQGFANAKFEQDGEEGLEVADEFYQLEDLSQSEQQGEAFDIQQGLKGSVTALN